MTKPFLGPFFGYKHHYQARKVGADDSPPPWIGLMEGDLNFENTELHHYFLHLNDNLKGIWTHFVELEDELNYFCKSFKW